MALNRHEAVRQELEVLMASKDEYEPDDHAAAARSYLAGHLSNAAEAIEKAAQAQATELRIAAINALEGN